MITDRIQKIIQIYEVPLFHKLPQCEPDIQLNTVWNTIVSADPSPNKKNVRWLVETYINNGYLWEDIAGGPTSKVYETLAEFNKHKRNLEPSQRSLMKYGNLASLWQVIKPYVGQLTSSEEKREERDKAYAEAEIIVDRDDGLKIICPKTKYASQWFGRGTRWCTASDNNNMFYRYAMLSPLFIIFMPNGDKLQLWKNLNDIQFMDENDAPVTKEYVEQNWDILGVLVPFIDQLQYYRESQITYDMCIRMAERRSNICEHIPEKYRNEELYIKIIEKNSDQATNIPYEHLTKNIILRVLKQSAYTITYFPPELLDEECWSYSLENGGSLRLFPEDMKSLKMCKKAVELDGWSLQFVPEKYWIDEIFRIAINQAPDVLDFIPQPLRTRELCELAVRKKGSTLAYVIDPENTFISSLYEVAVNNYPTALEHIPVEKRSYELCEMAVKQDSNAFIYVPDELKDYNLCKLALEHPDNNMAHAIPDNIWTQDLCDLIVKNSGEKTDIYSKPEQTKKNKTQNLFLDISYINRNVGSIPERFRNQDMYDQIAQKNILSLKLIPEKYHTQEMYRQAAEYGAESFVLIPQQNMTYEICKIAVENNGDCLAHIPNRFHTEELKQIAWENNGFSIEYLTDEDEEFNYFACSTKQIKQLFSNAK